jgi:hypothetical protein
VIGRQTFGESGITRFTMSMGGGIGCTPATAKQVAATTVENTGLADASAGGAVVMMVFTGWVYFDGHNIVASDADKVKQPRAPAGCAALRLSEQTGDGYRADGVVTMDIDIKSNTVRWQHHWPNRPALTPSYIAEFTLDKRFSLADYRPYLCGGPAVWTELEPSDAFPLFVPA